MPAQTLDLESQSRFFGGGEAAVRVGGMIGDPPDPDPVHVQPRGAYNMVPGFGTSPTGHMLCALELMLACFKCHRLQVTRTSSSAITRPAPPAPFHSTHHPQPFPNAHHDLTITAHPPSPPNPPPHPISPPSHPPPRHNSPIPPNPHPRIPATPPSRIPNRRYLLIHVSPRSTDMGAG